MKNENLAIITGASRGIGRAAAIRLASEYGRIAICCREDTQGLEETADHIRELGAQCMTFRGDMAVYEEVQAFLSQAVKTLGPPQILVNNAGISHIGLLQDMDSDAWNRILHTNLTSVFNSCNLVIPYMLQKHQGRIINISSVWGLAGASLEVAYSASKGGINAFTKALAKELAPSNISVNAIACGLIDTEMNGHLSEKELAAILEEIPAGRMGRPEEAAELVHLLAQAPSYLTGQVIALDGGWI